MSNAETRHRLAQVLQALNSVSVSGKVSLSNLVGSISVLEDMLREIPEEEESEEK